MSITPSALSAPGKVLLAGGYLVLDPKYSGLVFALSARIHSVSRENSDPEAVANTITVRSAQFLNSEWVYQITSTEDGAGTSVTQIGGSSSNPFIETTIRYVLSYLSITSTPALKIDILADNDYYSQPPSTIPHKRFNKLSTTINEAHKTGLGSSAALTTSFTACLLYTYLPSPPNDHVLHNLAQAAHCAAQGKIGSGFDVAAAVHGSHIYTRFSPSILEAVGNAGTPGFEERLREVINSQWDTKVKKTRVPPMLRLVMGDVDCGSATPSMVKKVLTWRSSNPELANRRWDEIHELNKGLVGCFDRLHELWEEKGEEWYTTNMRRYVFSSTNKDTMPEHDMEDVLSQLRAQIYGIRQKIREMGQFAGVEIEPDAQTKLLDAVQQTIVGVLGGVVPGAGGYDAAAFITADYPETQTGLKALLSEMEFKVEGGGKITVLGTREEHNGVQKEDVEQYEKYL